MNHITAHRATLQFVPQEEAIEFLQIRPAARRTAEQLFEIACRIHHTEKGKTQIYHTAARELGVAFNTIYLPVSNFLKTGDWRTLINRRSAGKKYWIHTTHTEHPPEFRNFWCDLVESNQRCAAAAYPILMNRLRRWRKGDPTAAIPGFPAPPPNTGKCKHPRKMSLRDLMRINPSKLETLAARNGRTAALKLIPSIFTSRKGGWPCMEYQFDDMWHDFEAIHGTQICRILEFNAVEFYSGFLFPPGLRPRILNESGKHESLTEKEFRLWAIHLLATVGWSPRGTTLQGERGTAAFRHLAPKLIHWSNGLLKTPLPGMSGTPAFIGGWAERAKGNPNAKALKEGMGKIIHNSLAHLPGQVGMNPQDKPASSFGRDKEARDLIRLQTHLTTDLTLTHLTFDQAAFAIYQKYDQINKRTQHAIEGYIEEGLFTQEYLADPANDTWIDIGTLPEIHRQALAIIAAAHPEHLRPRLLSPWEVLTPHLPNNIRLTPEAEADCLYEDTRRNIFVKNGHITFQDATLGPGKFRYIAEYQDPNGFHRSLPHESEIQFVMNPFNPERAFLFTLKGTYLGIVKRDHDILRADVDALHRKIGEKERRYKDAKLAAEVRHGLKRESTLTQNAAAILESLARPNLPRQTPPTFTDLSSEYAAAELTPQAPARHQDPSILL